MDAILKAIERMERREERRKDALARLGKKGQEKDLLKSDDETPSTPVKDDSQPFVEHDLLKSEDDQQVCR